MPLPLPRLADRRFEELMAEAEALVRARCPGWTDFGPGDPGVTLLEAFAFLTEVLLYRLNRVPEKVQIALLNLLGVAPRPPAAATVRLRFARQDGLDAPRRVPRGTRVADRRGELRFTLVEDADFSVGAEAAEALAVHAEPVEGELLGRGTGQGGQSVRLRQAPVLRPLPGLATLEIGVAGQDPAGLAPERGFAGQSFVLWEEVDSFLAASESPRPFLADRVTGVIAFGAGREGRALRAAVPPEGAEIRAWYWRGGGRAGNAAPGTLTVLEPGLTGLAVTNPGAASGGEDGETLAETIARGREEVRVVTTAITARDFERVALAAGGVARARAQAAREQWVFGEPGLVSVRLVPRVGAGTADPAVTPARLAERQTPELLDRAALLLAERRPLGVRTEVGWVRCRPVAVSARVVVGAAEEPERLAQRLRARLDRLIAPDGEWPFGRPLRASDAYEAILAEPGVRYAERLAFRIEDQPESRVADVLADPCQPGAAFAATATGLFRSLDAGRSWTRLDGGLPDTEALFAAADPETPGLLAAVFQRGANAWAVQVSRDGGERWAEAEVLQDEEVFDAAWLTRDGRPLLFLATRRGLRRLDLAAGRGSTVVDGLLAAQPAEPERQGFFAVATGRHPLGVPFVAVAARNAGGVLMSRMGGEARSFQAVGGQGRDIRRLQFLRDGQRSFLWAGAMAAASAEGEGVLRLEARADGLDPAGWAVMGKGWRGGSCEDFEVAGGRVFATTNRNGVASLDLAQPDAAWTVPEPDCGLPRPNLNRPLDPVRGVAVVAGPGRTRLLAGTERGLYASGDGRAWVQAGASLLREEVPLPPGWLYCSGAHELAVEREASGEAG